MSRITHLFLASALIITVTACGVDSGSRIVPVDPPQNPQNPTDPNPPNNKPEIDIKDGDEADFSALNRTIRRETYFGKPYDRADLEAVLRASGISTLNYATRLGINVYRVPRVDMSKPIYFYPLNFPPTEFDDLWKQESGGLEERVQLEGLYFDACPLNGSCQSSRVVRPTVLLNEAGDRWTLVHEMVHFMFNAQRKTEGLADVQTFTLLRKQSIDNFSKYQKSYREVPNLQDFMALTKEIDNLTRLTYGFSVVRDFEETAVENLLIDEWASKRLQHVPRRAVGNAVWYMNYGRQNALTLFEPLSEQIEGLITEADQKLYTEASRQLRATQAFIEKVRADTLQMIKRAERISGTPVRGGVNPRILVAGQVIPMRHDHRGCMTSEADRREWLNDIGRINAANGR